MEGGLETSGIFTSPVLHSCRIWDPRPHWHGFRCLHVAIRCPVFPQRKQASASLTLLKRASTNICTEQPLGLCGPFQKVQVTDLAINPDAVDHGAFPLPTDCCLDDWFFSSDWSVLSRISNSRSKKFNNFEKVTSSFAKPAVFSGPVQFPVLGEL